MKIHGEIRFFPSACNAKTFEFLALYINPTFCEFTTFLTEIHHGHFVFVFTFLTVAFFDLPFDRKPMAIPPRNIARVLAHHLLAAHHHIFEHFVQCMPNVKVTVGIGGAVMKCEGFSTLLFAQFLIDPDPLPAGKPFRFALRQSGTHRKIGFWKVQSFFIIRCLGAHLCHPWVMEIFVGKGQRDASGALSRRLFLSERRADNSMYMPRYHSHLIPLIVASFQLVQSQDSLNLKG